MSVCYGTKHLTFWTITKQKYGPLIWRTSSRFSCILTLAMLLDIAALDCGPWETRLQLPILVGTGLCYLSLTRIRIVTLFLLPTASCFTWRRRSWHLTISNFGTSGSPRGRTDGANWCVCTQQQLQDSWAAQTDGRGIWHAREWGGESHWICRVGGFCGYLLLHILHHWRAHGADCLQGRWSSGNGQGSHTTVVGNQWHSNDLNNIWKRPERGRLHLIHTCNHACYLYSPGLAVRLSMDHHA